MRTLLLITALAGLPLFAEQSVSKVALTQSNHSIHAFSFDGNVTLETTDFLVDLVFPAGKRERGNLLVVYDPHHGHYMWRYTEVGPPGAVGFLPVLESGKEAVFAESDELVDFCMPGNLYAKAHPERAASLEEAEKKSIEEVRSGLAGFETSGFHTDSAEITLFQRIGSAFFCADLGDPDFTPTCGHSVKLASIVHDGAHWRLVLEKRWFQEVILDSNFQFVSTRRVPPPAQE